MPFTGVRLLWNLIIYTMATAHWPEFSGLRGRRFPGQEEPRAQVIQPRRMALPPTFGSEWKNIGSRNKSFQDLGMPRYGPQKKIKRRLRSEFSFSMLSDEESRTSSASTLSHHVSVINTPDSDGRNASVNSDENMEFIQGTKKITPLTDVEI